MTTREPLSRLFSLSGRVAVVTGAAQGIGRAIAERFAEAGASVVIADRDAAAAETTAAEIAGTFKRPVVGVAADVTRRDEVAAAASRAVDEFGVLDVWVNNAGIYPQVDPVSVPTDEFERILRVNVTGVQHGMAAAVETLRRLDRPGVIVNVASTAAYRGSGPYSASKWAVRGLTQGMAAEVGRYGIRVVAVAPTVTDTPGMSSLLSGTAGVDLVNRVVAGIPLGRQGTPDDVARAAVFLASDAASFITGTVLTVDGGSLIAL